MRYNLSHDLSERFVSTVLMEHDPSERCVRFPKLLCKIFNIVQRFFFLELPINYILFQSFLGGLHLFKVVFCEISDTVLNNIVAERFEGCGKRGPPHFQVNDNATVDRDDPVVREVLVTNLTHFGLLRIKNFWAKRQKRKYNRCLAAQCNTSQRWGVAVNAQHIVDIIVLHRVNQTFNQLSVNFKSVEVSSRIFLRDDFKLGFFVINIPCLFTQSNDIISVLRC